MKPVVIYKVEVPFTDKNTKEDITVNSEIKISVERMKELNAHKVGRVIDIKLVDDGEKTPVEIETETNEGSSETDQSTNEGENPGSKQTTSKYTQEELETKTVNDLKELAEKEGIELTKAKKDEIIAEILEKLN